jgi:hypothetical protein
MQALLEQAALVRWSHGKTLQLLFDVIGIGGE